MRAIRFVRAGRRYVAPEFGEVLLRMVQSQVVRAAGLRHPDRAGLTDRERDVLYLVCEGGTNREVARALGISERTVKFHVSSILGKLQVRSRVELIASMAVWLATVAASNV
ncbi:hypothetical protein Val02_73160 [Virgisporangium aliadipatigenens]|uniref:HTH luxR-type domain-containing protein n=1 Tax=Virgisporangium aliadipatigenens TaxID=741659 RepID=A0A8J3YV59_9ACTN|nr:response regulator transcription factor [Virgisporangium aliadipatigenens]GIJ50430.1 hypothetical protein Val02_73160 [Virgisporangium aliadipatigenens]